jgi:hypothetical protein
VELTIKLFLLYAQAKFPQKSRTNIAVPVDKKRKISSTTSSPIDSSSSKKKKKKLQEGIVADETRIDNQASSKKASPASSGWQIKLFHHSSGLSSITFCFIIHLGYNSLFFLPYLFQEAQFNFLTFDTLRSSELACWSVDAPFAHSAAPQNPLAGLCFLVLLCLA